MGNVQVICPNPACDKDIELEPAKILRAKLRQKQTSGKPIIGCPVCCHIMILPNVIPDDPRMFERFISELEKSGDWLGECVPMIDPTMIRMPSGSQTVHGSTLYSSGTGELLDKYTYMVVYGIDPECAIYKSGKKPVKLGK